MSSRQRKRIALLAKIECAQNIRKIISSICCFISMCFVVRSVQWCSFVAINVLKTEMCDDNVWLCICRNTRICFSGRCVCVTRCKLRKRRAWTVSREASTRAGQPPSTSHPHQMRWRWWKEWKGKYNKTYASYFLVFVSVLFNAFLCNMNTSLVIKCQIDGHSHIAWRTVLCLHQMQHFFPKWEILKTVSFWQVDIFLLLSVPRLGYTYLRLKDNYMEILNKDDEIERLVVVTPPEIYSFIFC